MPENQSVPPIPVEPTMVVGWVDVVAQATGPLSGIDTVEFHDNRVFVSVPDDCR